MTTLSEITFKKLPGVLSFQRGLVISDAEFFNDINGEYEAHPVHVVRHGIRGTQNVNSSGKEQREVSNIQQTDSAKLDANADSMVARYSIRFLDLANVLFACAPGKKDSEEEITALRESIRQFIERAKNSTGVDEIACRFARNMANGRWLWRNRLIADAIKVTINYGAESQDFNALNIALNEFGDYSDAERNVASIIADGLRGKTTAALTVIANVDFGFKGAIEVFPSQNYIENKPDGFARSLYRLGQPQQRDSKEGVRIMGRAAIRDQKVSNALRTIDTWYPDFAEHGRPIPIEPNGASLDAQRFFRDNKSKASGFDLVRRLNQVDPTSDDGMFVTACLIRGGVYSE